jgi:hypothetical protein
MAPPTKRDDVGIINDIIKACEDKPSKDELATKIGELRESMKYPPLAGFRTTNREYVAKLRKGTEQLDKLLRHPPKDFPSLALFVSDEGSSRGAEERQEVFFGNMAWFRQRLDRLADADLGEHGSARFQQKMAVTASKELMERHGLQVAYSSPTSAFCRTVDLLWEAMTGKRQRLARACRELYAVPICTEIDE